MQFNFRWHDGISLVRNVVYTQQGSIHALLITSLSKVHQNYLVLVVWIYNYPVPCQPGD